MRIDYRLDQSGNSNRCYMSAFVNQPVPSNAFVASLDNYNSYKSFQIIQSGNVLKVNVVGAKIYRVIGYR